MYSLGLDVAYTLIEEASLPVGSVDSGNNIYNQNPLTNAAAGDLTLQASSPAIDAGNDADVPVGITTDAAGNSRITNCAVDMGAFETAAVPLPEITLSGTSTTNFGTVVIGGSQTLSYTIENTDTAVLNISSISETGSSDFSLSSTPSTVAVGASATFDVIFSPSAAGTSSATITINSNDCDEPSLSFGVSGTGIVPTITIALAPSTIDEDDGTSLTFTFNASVTPTSSLTVNFSVSGTATFSDDYTLVSGADSFSATAGTITIPAQDRLRHSLSYKCSKTRSLRGTRRSYSRSSRKAFCNKDLSHILKQPTPVLG